MNIIINKELAWGMLYALKDVPDTNISIVCKGYSDDDDYTGIYWDDFTSPSDLDDYSNFEIWLHNVPEENNI